MNDHRHIIKNTVTTLSITKALQKIRFQVRHPENVYAIIGIAATVSLYSMDGTDKYVPPPIAPVPVPSEPQEPQGRKEPVGQGSNQQQGDQQSNLEFPPQGNVQQPPVYPVPTPPPSPIPPPRRSKGTGAGQLSLALPEKGDVVYNELLRVSNNDFLDYFEKRINVNLPYAGLDVSGTRLTYFETRYIIQDALLEGYYESFYLPPSSVQPDAALYQLRLYIKYQTHQP